MDVKGFHANTVPRFSKGLRPQLPAPSLIYILIEDVYLHRWVCLHINQA